MLGKKLYQLGAIAVLLSSLCACQSWGVGAVKPGQTEAEVIAQLGQPTHIYRHGDQLTLEYMRGRMGQATHMAIFGTDGKLISYQQVLTMENFSKITVDVSNKDAVLRLIGAPSLTNFYSRTGLEAWSYPFKQDGAWNSLMAVYFDSNGIVRKLENGPDPAFDHEERGRGRGR
ncbi:outer membrane protein assembly factor BamE domain-containing protein [Undibacterium sp. Dicai25W]|uniref:outer membrane protein assembly factor BamE domain-containing protein n=1 Tax=Undibacterium sp. Dicai25W TaxID=3413034 RepID=UPI003BF203C5